jgi:hypothetical protein
MATTDVRPDVQAADARVAALRQDPRVIVHRRTTRAPYEPVIEGTPKLDVLEILGRREPATEDAPASDQ